jgi:hypothetical protein
MNIHQMQMSYLTQEDRLILSINSQDKEEFRLFLTRRIIISFWDILNRTITHSLSAHATPDDLLTIPESQKQQMEQKITQQIQYRHIIEKDDYETPFNKRMDRISLVYF